MDRDLRTQTRRIVTERDPHEHARLLAAQIRAGVKVPKPMRNAPPLNIVVPKRKHCLLHAWEDRPGDMLPVLRLRACAGDEAGREVLGLCDKCLSGPFRGKPCRCHIPCGCDAEVNYECEEHADYGIHQLLRLAEALPDVAVSGAECWRHGLAKGTPPCLLCKPTPASRYLAACIGLAVGRAALPVWEAENSVAELVEDPSDWISSPRKVLDACERWTWCPCPSNAGASPLRETYPTPEAWWRELPFWNTEPRHLAVCLAKAAGAAASLIGPEAVREAARLMVLKVTGEPA